MFCWCCGRALSTPEPVKDLGFEMWSENHTVEVNSEGLDFIILRTVSPLGQVFAAVSRLNAVVPSANEQVDDAYLQFSLVRQIDHAMESLEEAMRCRPDLAGLVNALLEWITPLMARLVKDVRIGTMAYGDTDAFTREMGQVAARYNRLVRQTNPGANPTLWPEPLMRFRRGDLVDSQQPPQFATLIDNKMELKDWVMRSLPANALEPLAIPFDRA